ncbi:hypothetical protein DSM19430T_07620 [Desulfovibrio psychrotolerans]|uniref:Uncharacterized protein n=1 Tax=Desulfovibrio psychrotolerans TaxID=415242 RepID=A0A7J0BQZ5_9BACT|nr:hypothetical protein DSM19430T_07620 [Desulfovibrio psychrotolerans]
MTPWCATTTASSRTGGRGTGSCGAGPCGAGYDTGDAGAASGDGAGDTGDATGDAMGDGMGAREALPQGLGRWSAMVRTRLARTAVSMVLPGCMLENRAHAHTVTSHNPLRL